jgi:hypothetical protein
VSLGCADKGRLMADLWTSALELFGGILARVKVQSEAYKAVASALHRTDRTKDRAFEHVERSRREHICENIALKKLVDELRQHLAQAEVALWGKGSGVQASGVSRNAL